MVISRRAALGLLATGAAALLGLKDFVAVVGKPRRTPKPTPTPTSTPTPTPTPMLTSSPSGTYTYGPEATVPTVLTGTEGVDYVILAQDTVFDGFSTTPFDLSDAQAQNANIKKVIRRCTFSNGTIMAIRLAHVRNLLIEQCLFSNIRSGAASDTHAIEAPGNNPADDITIRMCTFEQIGADGFQAGAATAPGNLTGEVTIEFNRWIGPNGAPVANWWGENFVDIKGCQGPITLYRNEITGTRECVASGRGGSQLSCTGSPGEGVVIHDATSGRAQNVTIKENLFRDNGNAPVATGGGSYGGLIVSDADNVNILGNLFENNTGNQVLVVEPNAGPGTYGGNTVIGGASVNYGDFTQVAYP